MSPGGMPFAHSRTAQVEIVVPVRDEERDLGPSIRRLVAYLSTRFPFRTVVTITDNGSTDRTWAAARALAREFDGVRAVHLEQSGRGRALRSVWSASDADMLAYMDVDLSTDLNALLPLVAPLLSGHSDLAIGTRLARGARVVRGPRREVISRCYNVLLHATLSAGFSDAQCGFKAIRADKARLLLPLTRDAGWFFDSELLVLAERAGLRIHEVPVDWVDDPDSKVNVVATALADLRGIARLRWDLARGTIRVPRLGTSAPPGRPGGPGEPARPGARYRQLARFLVVGVASTLAYVLLYLGLRTGLPAQPANAISLLATALLNTAVNRRFTFGIRGRPGLARHQAQGLLAFGAGLALTSAALAALHAVTARPARATEVTVLVLANLLATMIRFVIYRHWVFRQRRPVPAPGTGPATGPAAAASLTVRAGAAARPAAPGSTDATMLSFPAKNGHPR
jgi:putative flippase GtrA